MRFTKPAWVSHGEKRTPIYSLHVHPDGSRLATGSLDTNIRVWSTLPILRPDVEKTDTPKLLCTMSMHSGSVLVVRWSHSGKWLASGSDDNVVVIWDLDPRGGGSVWGSDVKNIEGWKALKRLPGHSRDVIDLAWSPDDRYLASAGLDSKVYIWCGYTLEPLKRLDLHEGFVKGVCWDPVGQYLATQSDDKSVKIWRTTDWGLEASITKPFEDSGGNTFFRRLSWSPDGAHITASNARNNNGYVFVAAVISRQTWTSDISLVGHENSVEVAAYNPHIFVRRQGEKITANNICSVVALGSDDLSVSVWQTKSARPLIAAKDVFSQPVLDLCWSHDGLTLYACSQDGTIAVFDFDPSELDGIAPHAAQAEYLKMFNFTPELDSGTSPAPMQIVEPIAPTPIQEMPLHPPPPPPTGPNVTIGSNGKRRIRPVFVSQLSSMPSSSLPTQIQTTSSNPTPASAHMTTMAPPTTYRLPPPPNVGYRADLMSSAPSASFSTPPQPQFSHPQQQPLHNGDNPFAPPIQSPHTAPNSSRIPPAIVITDDVDMQVPINAWEGNARKKRDDSDGAPSTGRPTKPRTLGGDRSREPAGPVRELRGALPGEVLHPSFDGINAGIRLEIPSIKTHLTVRLEDKEDTFEGRNYEEPNKPSEVVFLSGKNTQFLDYVPGSIIGLAVTSTFCAAALEDGSVNVYSPTGRRLMPTLMLDAPCSFLDGSKSHLMAITCRARIYIWNIKTQRVAFPPTSLDPILNPNTTIHAAQIRPNGAPIILLTSGCAYTYDPSLCAWSRISEPRWGQGSDTWEGKQRAHKSTSSRSIMASLENAISELGLDEERAGETSSRPQWWNAALTLGHLETRMHAAKLVDSPSEYKTAVLLYAKKIAEEAFKAKAEELIKELCGPLYWKPGRDDTVWCPTVLGMQKRDLLKDVVGTFARSKTLAKLGQDWQETLKKVVADE